MAEPLHFVPTLPPEELARAHFYGLLARLFYAPPDAQLLQALGTADEIPADDGGIALAWRDLSHAAAKADPEAVREEYETAFVGTGKAPVTLYTTAYTLRYSSEAPLAELRAALWNMRLARREEAAEPEDHVAALCDVMRHLIATQKSDLESQKRFFARWIWPAAEPLCNAIVRTELTVFYKPVARFFASFCAIEHSSFEML